MGLQTLVFLLFAAAIATVDCNPEGDALYLWKSKLVDPSMVLQSWDPTLINPCTWFHVTCNNENSVIRVDLGNSGISGPLVPALGNLSNLQYLEVFGNKISGTIPKEIGMLTNLRSLGLHQNQLSGSIPSSLGNLRYLMFMRLNSNRLSGSIPAKVIQLISWGNLRVITEENLLSFSPSLPFFLSCRGFQGLLMEVGTLFLFLVLSISSAPTNANLEGDALYALRRALTDPGNVLQSWDPTLVNPCTWFHVTCDRDYRVTRLDLGNAKLSGNLVPELGRLERLQYLELYRNNLVGPIPKELGGLKSLLSLDLYHNNLTGPIPPLSTLSTLRFLFQNNPRLEGPELRGSVSYDIGGGCN
ncbi:hypothetical protein HHK36_015902 [Tetracentron sinense]|uniref:Leucine-rich repeat-containing N-terminal plant-type domain-containing protein n=1 Tax=Tetracentron sinense TaxID=13715 RepID=A0A834Z800_TETSI|nr:hypothetical protein HHK36_015902 [Tetracentron sinense]